MPLVVPRKLQKCQSDIRTPIRIRKIQRVQVTLSNPTKFLSEDKRSGEGGAAQSSEVGGASKLSFFSCIILTTFDRKTICITKKGCCRSTFSTNLSEVLFFSFLHNNHDFWIVGIMTHSAAKGRRSRRNQDQAGYSSTGVAGKLDKSILVAEM